MLGTRRGWWLVIAGMGVAGAGAVAAAAPAGGLVVERVQAGQALARAGVQVGDVVLAASLDPPSTGQAACRVELTSPFQWFAVEEELAPLGSVRLHLVRGEASVETTLPPGLWGAEVAPRLGPEDVRALAAALEPVRAGRPADAGPAVEALAASLGRAGRGDEAAWVRVRAGDELVAARRWADARPLLEGALAQVESAGDFLAAVTVRRRLAVVAERLGDLAAAEVLLARAAEPTSGVGELVRAETLGRLAAVVRQRGDLPRAQATWEEVLAARERLAPGSLDVAAALNGLSTVAFARGDLATSQSFAERALATREKLVPGSLEVAGSLHNLGVLSRNRGELERAAEYYARALPIYESQAPGSAETARILNSMGVLAGERGELGRAEELYRRALALREKLSPDSLAVAGTLTNLGIVAYDRGDLAGAEACHQRALAIRQRLAPESLDVANSLNELGNVALDRHQLERALELYRQHLAVSEKAQPDGPGVAIGLRNVGEVQLLRGDYRQAQAAFERSLAVDEKQSPGSLAVARGVRDLARVASARGEPREAVSLLERALAIVGEKAAGSLEEAICRYELGRLALGRGDRATAARQLAAAIAIRERLAPGSQLLAEALYALGGLRRDEGRLAEAAELLRRAVAALEAQKRRLGGGREAAELFSSAFADVYRDLVDLLVRLEREDEAFSVLERYRARVLLEMLAERDLDFSRDAPAEMLAERQRVEAEVRKVEEELARPEASLDGGAVARLGQRLAQLRERREEVAARIRQASPRLAALQYPTPLDLPATKRALEPDTLLLSYSAGNERTLVFALLGRRFEVHDVKVPRRELAGKVREYRRLLADPASPQAELQARGGELGRMLLGPVEPWLGRAKRVLVCPDGPLNLLPFAALRVSGGAWLASRAPSFQALSVTVFAQDRARRRAGVAEPRVVAFGDPRYPGTEEEAKRAVRWAALRTGELAPLPATRGEVDAIAALFGERAQVFLGEQAREEGVKRLGRDVTHLHLACHGLLDMRFPLESGLALAVREGGGDGDDGLLQAWEVLEGVRLDAELVTLSACETGLGAEMGGEGLVGLTRAFQYAGARSVVSTLWSVADESTARLMERFYAELHRGRSKASALQAAQQSLIAHSGKPGAGADALDLSHPFFWAGFQLTGDWQ